jgi:UDP-2-acetamido-3-amino-2,3-dideoxy-glucuronate N-acetyltransferase
MSAVFIHPTACVDSPASLGEATQVWHFCHVMPGARVGRRCTLGQNVFVASRVVVGDDCRIQNNVSLYDGTTLEDDVFLGPSCVLTNVENPRAQIHRRDLFSTTRIRRGATVGANATIVCGVTVGRYAFIGAGAVVTRDVPDYALILGVPGKRRGWMSRHGHKLAASGEEGLFVCPESGYLYRLIDDVMRCLDRDEEAPLPEEQAVGVVRYRDVARREPGAP